MMRLRISRNELLLIILIAIYTAVFTYFSWVRYVNISAPTFDMGVKIQSIYSALYGIPIFNGTPVITFGAYTTNYFQVHFSPIIYVLSPFTHIFDPAAFLFAVQWFVLSMGSLVVYWISMKEIGKPGLSLIIAVIYLVYPPTIMSGMYDMHLLAFFPFSLLLLYYALISRRRYLGIFAFILGTLSQEAFLLIAVFVALQFIANESYEKGGVLKFYKIERNYLIIGISIIAVSLILFYLEVFVFMQSLNTNRGNLITSTSGYGIAIQNVATYSLIRIAYWLLILGFAGFFPIIGYKKGIVVLPFLVLSLFSLHINFDNLGFQYSLTVTAGIFIALVEGVRIVNRRFESDNKIRYSHGSKVKKLHPRIKAMLAVVILFCIAMTPALPPTNQLGEGRAINMYTASPDFETMNKAFSEIPQNSNILASDYLFAHLAENTHLYPIVYNFNSSGLVLYNYLPATFIPQYIVIYPSDLKSVRVLVQNFDTSYHEINSFNYTFTYYTGLFTEHSRTVRINIYELNRG